MSERTVLMFKMLICGIVVTVAIGFMAQLLWPALGIGALVLFTLAGWSILAGLILLLVANTAISSWINQWILQKGGTDPQWLWFPADPPGLQRDRKSHKP